MTVDVLGSLVVAEEAFLLCCCESNDIETGRVTVRDRRDGYRKGRMMHADLGFMDPMMAALCRRLQNPTVVLAVLTDDADSQPKFWKLQRAEHRSDKISHKG